MLDGRPEIYLAGPEVFLVDPWARAHELKAVCAARGAVGWFPMDNQADVTHPDPAEMAARISRADEALVRRCDAIVANMTPFRGPSMDAGTVFEMGLGKGLGKVVVGWTEDRRRWQDKIAQMGPLVETPTGMRDADGNLVRDFGLIDNLMIVKGADFVTDNFAAAVDFVVAHFRR
jgi:nucleoside 2-deoxyribosyltransferase